MQVPKAAQDVPSDTRHPLPQETTLAARLVTLAAWRFKREVGKAQPRDAQEVSAMNAIFNELMRPDIYPDAVFDLLVESAATLTEASGSAIALAEGGRFVYRAAYGSTAPPVGSTHVAPSSGLSGLCVRTGNMLCCDDAENDPRVDSSLTREAGIRAISLVPLIKDGKLVGIFELLSTRAHAFGNKETETLQRMAKLVVLTMTRMGELRGKSIERKARGRWWRVLSLMLLAFFAGTVAYPYAATGGKPEPAQPAPVATPPAPVATADVSDKPAVREVTMLLDGNIQVAITLDQPILYDAHRLDHPHRVYVDLHGARLAPELAGKTYFVNNGGVSSIRLALRQPDTVRVVLDLEKRFDYSVAQQTNPATLVMKLTPLARASSKRLQSAEKKLASSP